MEKLKIEGIIINAFPFQDYDRILSLFTPEEGLIKLLVKGAFSRKKSKGGTTTPLNQIEAVYTKGRGELYACQEIAILNSHLGLRKNLPTLDAACDMLQVIGATQMPGKAAPELYQLLITYLSRLPSVSDPATISASFRLKTLRYEGLMALAMPCSSCKKSLNDSFIAGREAYCYDHAPADALVFSSKEMALVEEIALGRDFSRLASLSIPALLAAKVVRFFNDSLNS